MVSSIRGTRLVALLLLALAPGLSGSLVRALHPCLTEAGAAPHGGGAAHEPARHDARHDAPHDGRHEGDDP
ncbi:MAG TPA: hypothetical protein VNK43_03195, partial [Gemmatimonadales bacterium]|nr:hypothetical protein [Gemmatimonadales bacterium]